MYLKPTYQKVDKIFLKNEVAEAVCIIGYKTCPGPYCAKGYSS